MHLSPALHAEAFKKKITPDLLVLEVCDEDDPPPSYHHTEFSETDWAVAIHVKVD